MPDEKENALNLYRLEYERASIRYNEIYQSVWSIFSYLAIVSGAILTFGGKFFEPEYAIIFSIAPLMFWYWATYEPLNSYADKVLQRLKDIEKIFFDEYKADIKHYTIFCSREGVKWYRRVRVIVRISGGLLLILALLSIINIRFNIITISPNNSHNSETFTLDLKNSGYKLNMKWSDVKSFILDENEITIIESNGDSKKIRIEYQKNISK